MELQPKRPPGRADRKAALYASEIARLRSAGYTYEAIREALFEVGIELSTSALRREMRRRRMHASSHPSGPHPAPRTPAGTAHRSPHTPPRPLAPDGSSSHEVAEAFFKDNPSNPLLQTKEIP